MRRLQNAAWPIGDDDVHGLRIGREGRVSRCFWTREMMVLLSIIVAASVWLVNQDPGRGAAAVRMARGDSKTQNIAFAFSPDGATIATTQSDLRVTLRDVVDGWSIRSVPGCRGFFMGLAFSPDGRFLALGGIEPDDITLLDLRGTGTERRLGMAVRCVKALAFSPDGKVLAATSFLQNEIVLWDMDAGRPLGPLGGHGSPVLSMAFAPDGQSLASGARDDEAIIVWDLTLGRPRRRLEVPRGPVDSIVYSPDGGRLASVSPREGCSRLWDLASGRQERTIRGRSVAFSPDGRLFAATGLDARVRVSSIATGQELHDLDGQADWLIAIAFSPDGRTLAAIASDNDVRFWDMSALRGSPSD